MKIFPSFRFFFFVTFDFVICLHAEKRKKKKVIFLNLFFSSPNPSETQKIKLLDLKIKQWLKASPTLSNIPPLPPLSRLLPPSLLFSPSLCVFAFDKEII